ncbi:MAG: sulfurtransferase [Flavobacteriales bacterium]|nr:sulfurtransferase [Flavobacteriales bacterium]
MVLDLVEPAELHRWNATDTPAFVLDVRPITSYHHGHIPDAIQVWRDAFTRNDLPYSGMSATRETIQHLLDSLGLKAGQQVVVYDDRGGCDAARVWWLLKVHGHRKVALLNGGIPRWRTEGLPVTLKWVRTKPSGYVFPDPVDSSLVATLEHVKRAVEDGRGVLLDTRSRNEFSGAERKEGAFRAGTIPGSVLYDWGNAVAFDKDKILKDAGALQYDLAALGIQPDDTVITFGHSGVRSAHTTYVLTAVLGMKNVRNYDGSWTEWSYHDKLPVRADSFTTTSLP